MKKRTILILLIFSVNSIFSQLVDVVSAKDAGIKELRSTYSTFTKANTLYMSDPVEKDKAFTYRIAKLNNDLTEAFKQVFPTDAKEEQVSFEVKQNKILCFTTIYDGSIKTLYLRVLDNATGKLLSDKKAFGSLESDRMGVHGRIFSIAYSSDESKLLVVSAFQWPKKPQVVKADIYDAASLKLINTFSLPDTYNNIMIKTSNYNVSNAGNVMYIVRPDIKEKDAPKKETIAVYDVNAKANKFIELPLDKKLVYNYSTFIKDEVFYFTGLFKDDYTKKDGKDNKAGVFCITFNLKTNSIANAEFSNFSQDIDTKLSYKDGNGNRDLCDKEFTLNRLIQTNSGFYTVENLTYTVERQGKNTILIKSYSREFIVSKFNSNGKLEFTKIVPKYTDEKMYGQDFLESNGNLYIFYCEHPKNLEKYTVENFDPKDYDDVKDLTGPMVVCVKVDGSSGALTRQTLYRNETWCYAPGYGRTLKAGSDLVVMKIFKDEYDLEVFRVKK